MIILKQSSRLLYYIDTRSATQKWPNTDKLRHSTMFKLNVSLFHSVATVAANTPNAKMSGDTISTLLNGLSYYVVDVTSNDGTLYIIQAYEEEAMQLFVESQQMKMNPLISVS